MAVLLKMDKKQAPNFMKKIKKINKDKLGKDLVVTKIELEQFLKNKLVSKEEFNSLQKEVR